MKLVYIFAAVLAVSFAETEKEKYEDLVAMETMELKKESSDLTPQASVYNYVPPSQRPPLWTQNYVPQQTWTPPRLDNVQPIPFPSVSNNPPYVPPVTASPPSYVPPVQSDYVPPQNHYPPQNTYYPHWSTPHYHHTTTTPTPVIKNEQWFGENGSYRYEYQIADGTWVGEEGYYTDPHQTDESLVKKGWYSYKGADGKTYTVSYWADHTGYHAYGDHLPKAPVTSHPVVTYPTTQKPVYPTHYPQNTYYPPSYGKK